MTRPRRVLTVVVERCVDCPSMGWDVDGEGQCRHTSRQRGRRTDYPYEPPPEWCPLPCEPSGKSGQLEEP